MKKKEYKIQCSGDGCKEMIRMKLAYPETLDGLEVYCVACARKKFVGDDSREH